MNDNNMPVCADNNLPPVQASNIDKWIKRSIILFIIVVIPQQVLEIFPGILVWPFYRLFESVLPADSLEAIIYILATILFYAVMIPPIIMVGRIVNKNGFKFALGVKGFIVGCLVSLPAIVMTMYLIYSNRFHAPEPAPAISYVLSNITPFRLFSLIAINGYEEVFYRALLMTPFLVKLSDKWTETILKRVSLVLVCGAIFWILHSKASWQHGLWVFVFGVVMCAVYTYSKNLLSCVVMHISINLLVGFAVVEIPPMYYGNWDVVRMLFVDVNPVGLIALSVLSIVISVLITVRAKPFMPIE